MSCKHVSFKAIHEIDCATELIRHAAFNGRLVAHGETGGAYASDGTQNPSLACR